MMRKSILLIDDDQIIQSVYEAYLCKAGYTVIGVFSGKEAVECVDNQEFDIILIDYKLPDIYENELLDAFELRKMGEKSRCIIQSAEELPESIYINYPWIEKSIIKNNSGLNTLIMYLMVA
jgi:DNA-binding NtrC family response regulator